MLKDVLIKAAVLVIIGFACVFLLRDYLKPKPVKKEVAELRLRAAGDPKPSLDGILEAQQETAFMVVRSCLYNSPIAAMAFMKPRKLELAQQICARITKVLPASEYRIMEKEKVKIEPFGKDEKLAKVPFVLVDGGGGTIFLYMKESSGTWWVVR